MGRKVMKKLARTIALLGLVLLAAAAIAHDGAHGMKGTVTAISDDTITLETPAKQSHTVHFDSTTKFQKSGASASVKDLKVGDRVVIQANDSTGKMHAVQVRFGKPGKANHGKSHGKREQ